MSAGIEVLVVPHSDGLDAITVYWHNYAPGQGMVTFVCWGAAWNAYFGGMSGQTIQEFFARADVDYLVNKLTDHQWQKLSKRHETYLGKLVTTIKAQLAKEAVCA